MSNMNLFRHGENTKVIDGSITNLSRNSKKLDSYIAWTRQKHWSDQQLHVLWSEFDLTIAYLWFELGYKDWKIIYPRGDTILLQHEQVRHPFKKKQSRIELLSFNSPSCCQAQPTSSGLSIMVTWRKEQFRELAYSRTRHHDQVTTWRYF